MTADFSSSIH